MEEQFNTHVTVIPESEDGAIKLTAEIQSLKENLEKMSQDVTSLKS